jgi:hypothetical protein
MEEKKLSEQESLIIIQQMIETAKQEQKDNGKGWIVWGWLLFTASVFTWFNVQFGWFANNGVFWNVLGELAVLYLLFLTIRYFVSKKPQRVRTYTCDLFEKLNIGFFIFLFLIILSMNLGVSAVKGFILLIGLYGFWILIYGTALNFKPSIIAAYIMWAIAFAGLFIDKFETSEKNQFQLVMLFHAIAVLCGYIIPGHIANREFNKLNKKGDIIQSV